jgi:hypothetical protein
VSNDRRNPDNDRRDPRDSYDEELCDYPCAGAGEADFASIEEAIRAAGAYVVPSDDLRPRTLEAARELSEDRRTGIRLGRFAVVLLLFIVISAPLAERAAAWYERATSPSAAELQAHALEIAQARNVGPDWGLFEAFTRLRRMQATRLGQAGLHTRMQ